MKGVYVSVEDTVFSQLKFYWHEKKSGVLGLLTILLDETQEDREKWVYLDTLHQLYELIFPVGDFVRDIQELCNQGYLKQKHEICHIPAEISFHVAASLAQLSEGQSVPFGNGITLNRVLEGFQEYCLHEVPGLIWHKYHRGTIKVCKEGKAHYLQARLIPLLSAPPQGGTFLGVGVWGDDMMSRVAHQIVLAPWLKNVALYDLTGGKINIVPSDIFPYFDWYLRDEFRLRIAPCKDFALVLMQRGVMRTEG